MCSFTLLADRIVLKSNRVEVNVVSDDLVYGKDIIANLPAMIDDFQLAIGSYPDFKAKIYLSHDKEDFEKLTSRYGGITEFSRAFYNKRDKRIYIKSYHEIENREAFYQILLHEYIHAFIDYHLKDAPLWFHEGMAVYFSKQYSLQMTVNLGLDYLAGDVKHISRMEKYYPDNSINLSSFYAKSVQAVRYLYQEDSSAFSSLFESKGHFTSAIIKAYKMTPTKFYKEFESSFKFKIYINAMYGLLSAIWVLLPIFLFIGWYKQSKKREKAIEEMPEDEEDVKII
jgi:hypothetical protein